MQGRAMKFSTVIVPAFLALSTLSYAQDKMIYKCVDPEGIVYRDTPCATQQEQTLITNARKVNWQNENGRANPPVDSRVAASPLYAPRLFMGMTDTQVLNLPSWGRPARIVRSKAGHLWREQWIYKDRSTGDERSFLYFENARLVDQEDAPTQPFVQARVTIQ
jgi:hypothetical protein